MAIDVEAEIDRLYAAPFGDFTKARDDLAARLRVAKERSAPRVKALKRPSLAAWAVNRVARQAPAKVAELEQVARELRDAQRRSLSRLQASGLREVTRRQRELVAELTNRALAELEAIGRASEAQRSRISETFHAGTMDVKAAQQIREGRLTKELRAEVGLGDGSGLELLPLMAAPEEEEAPPRKAAKKPKPEKQSDRVRERKAEEARAAAREAARKEAERARAQARRIGEERDEAEAARREALARVEHFEVELAKARDALEERERAWKELSAEAARAEKARARAEAAARKVDR